MSEIPAGAAAVEHVARPVSGRQFEITHGAARVRVGAVAAVLREYNQTVVEVAGHTDNIGGQAFNQGLSERRAAAVADYLSTRGVQSARIGTRGFGETQPIATNETEEGRAANRRVEIKIVPISQNEVG